MELLIAVLVALGGSLVVLLLLYFVIKAAVAEGLREHTRWLTANRDEIEAKYSKPARASD